jgi:alpha-galactosidase
MSAEELAYTMCTGMLGRLYLSGHLDLMPPGQRAAVRTAVRVHQAIRADLAAAVPSWPLGLPGWDDPWLSLALRTREVTYLAVWRRGGVTAPATLALPHLRGREVRIDVLYPRDLPAWRCDWAAGSLAVTPTGAEPAARLIKITTLCS